MEIQYVCYVHCRESQYYVFHSIILGAYICMLFVLFMN